MKNLPLRYQIALATFVPLVLFALLAGVLGAYGIRRFTENLVLDRQTAMAQVAAAGVAGNLRGHVRLLETTAAELAVATGDAPSQQRTLSERAGILGVFDAVSLLDVGGNVTATTVPGAPPPGASFADQDYFRQVQAAQTPVFSTLTQYQQTGRPVVVIAVPVQRSGIFAGALLGTLALDRPDWARDLNLLRTPQGGKAYLVDSASTIIYHPDSGRVGSNIQADPDLWRLVIAGQPGSLLYRPPSSTREVVAAFTPIPGIPWGLIVEEPWDEILASLVAFQWAMGGLIALGIALALVALVWSINRVTRPLNALVSAGQRVAQGKPYETLPLRGSPDLRTLIQVINDMVAHLGEQQAALRDYARQVVRGQEDERLRISRDLHDETVQDLVALNQRLELCTDALLDDPPTARRRLREVRALAGKTLAGVRRISHNLRPSTLADLGLVAALQALTQELGQQLPQARVHCEVVGREVRLAPELELTAFRVAQEALSNVRKHASAATLVSVALIFEDWGLLLLVEDDGGGFELPDRETLVERGHLGLVGMAERARLFGGTFGVVSTPGEGTTVTLRLPQAAGEAVPATPKA